jgi:hypothetical protein
MSNMAARLKPLDLAIKDEFLIYLILNSVPKEFETFEVNYKSLNEKWTLEKFMALCVQEEERIKRNIGGVDSVNLAKHKNKKRNFVSKLATNNEEKHKGTAKPPVEKEQCKWCFKRGHYQKNYIKFLKHLNIEGEDYVTFVNESMFLSYARSTWSIDSGTTVHVANSLWGLVTRRMFRRGERSIRVANCVEAEVEAIGELPLDLNDGFILCMHNGLYVPSLSRNLIFISCLDDDGFNCQFGNKQCLITSNSKLVGPAYRQDKLYMLSIHENVNVVCNNENIVCDDKNVVCSEKASSSTNVSSKRKRCDDATLVKLWHYRLGHILRGRIERLIKDDIIHPLDFSNSYYCIDCIKGKYAKQVKKGEAKRSAGILEIIHVDISGPYPINYVDGFDSFITFTDDVKHYGYIYLIQE